MLQVNDIFESISGEAGGFPQGTWASFIRLQGCNLSCDWCDTPQARERGSAAAGQAGAVWKMEGTAMTVDWILEKVDRYHVLVTGGEPLLQSGTVPLLQELIARGHSVQVETNGSKVTPLLPNVHWVIDRKTPSSKMEDAMPDLWVFTEMVKAIRQVGSHAYIKWVVSGEADVQFMAQEIQSMIQFGITAPFIVSPVHARGFGIPDIVDMLRLQDPQLLDLVTFSIQLHKLFKLP